MSTFDTTRTTFGSTAATGHVTGVFSRALASVVAWNDARITRNALKGLSDRELDDIGLSRDQINLVADQKIKR